MMFPNRRRVSGLAVLAFVSAALSGCGGGGDGSSSPFQTARFTEYAAPGAGNDPTSVPGGVWPDDVAGDAAGNIWFPEHHGNAIARISPTGVFTEFPVPT